MDDKQNQEVEQTPSQHAPASEIDTIPDNSTDTPSLKTGMPQNPVKKPRLPSLVKIVSFLFWIPFILLALVYAYLINEANHGVSGTEFAGIILAPVALLVTVVGLLYIVLLLIYIKSKHSSKYQKIISLVVLIFLLAVYGWQIIGAMQQGRQIFQNNKLLSDDQTLSLIGACKVESVQKNGDKVSLLLVSEANYDVKGNWIWQSTTASSANWDKFVAEVQKVKAKCGGNVDAFDAQSSPKYSWISVEEAKDLLEKCEIKTFNYTPSSYERPFTGTPTGIILTESTTIKHISLEPSTEGTMIPIARSVQPKCGGPQFYHDGHYEQRQADGSWQ